MGPPPPPPGRASTRPWQIPNTAWKMIAKSHTYTFSNNSVSICRSVQNCFIDLKKQETVPKLKLTGFLLGGFCFTWERWVTGGLEETICVHVPVLPIEVERTCTCSTFRLLVQMIYHQVPIRLLELSGRASGLRKRTSTAVDDEPRCSLCFSTQHLHTCFCQLGLTGSGLGLMIFHNLDDSQDSP